jgi:hypothetical protein
MAGDDWSRQEVEAIVDDYLSMLMSELAGTAYSKAAHRRALKPLLRNRSDPSIEFKHANISAALLDAGFPYIAGYKPRFNYQSLLAEILGERIDGTPTLLELAASDADRPIVVPEVEDILAALTERPKPRKDSPQVRSPRRPTIRAATNYIEREARNRSLGAAGEAFVINFERARLIAAGKEALASKIEHTSKLRGDGDGYDVLSFDSSGKERLIEVKTTKYGDETPFFVTRNEVAVSLARADLYHVYRLYAFKALPRLFTLPGAIESSCSLSPATYLARPA